MSFKTCLTFFFLVITLILGAVILYLRIPGPNGLGYFTEAEEAVPPNINLTGKNAIVTGGHSGIGFETVRVLALRGARVWILSRDLKRCEQALIELKQKSKNSEIYCEEMNLSSLASVRNFAENWNKKQLPLHILINNAGILACPYAETVDGYELQFATNYLGHFLLTNLLMDRLREGKPSRVINVSSINYAAFGIQFDDLTGKNTWYNGSGFATYSGPFLAYAQSKTAKILFTIELNERMKGFGNSYALHPGTIITKLVVDALSTYIDSQQLIELISFLATPLFKTPSQGSSTQLYLATSPDLEGVGGKYYVSCNEVIPYPHATDPVIAKKLWELSEKMVHLK